MGACAACQSCGQNTCEFIIGDLYLEPYQVPGKKQEKLNKYDKFFKIVCDPLPRLNVYEFLDDLDKLISECETEFETNNPG